MKSGRGHRVPLSRAAISVLKEMQGRHQDDLVFPGDRRGKPLSNMAVLMVLRRMGPSRADGAWLRVRRSATGTAECTYFPGEVTEAALAHVVGDKVEAAYRAWRSI
jgi:integrase